MNDLRTRLARLGVASGAVAEPAAPARGVPLAARIARLRVRAATLRSERPSDPQLAAQLGGSVSAPGLVEVVRSYPLPLGHGATRIASGDELAAGVRLSSPADADFAPERLLLLDTETSGLAGGTGTAVFVVGLATIRDETILARQLLMTGFAGERTMLQVVLEAVKEADCLATFNGKSFDVPLLRARTRLAELDWPAGDRAHIDLLHVTRRRLREGWPDCRLRTAEQRALGFARTDDLPGADVPAAWQRWLRSGDAAQLPGVLDHNREDLLSLVALLAVLAHPTAREAPLLHARSGRPAAGA